MQKPGKHPLSVESGATGMGKWAQAFGGTGLLEMNIGRNGISMQLGMNGIDVGGALYDLGKRSYDKSMLQQYEREHGKDKGEAAYSAYVYGDWTQEHTAARLASGKDELYFSGGKEYTAKTSSNGKGGRRIEITDSKDRRLNAIQLGHEAYRDGKVGGNNAQETIAAVLGHTGMAVRMEEDGKRVNGSDLLRAEMEAYKRGDMDALLMNALTNYDSSDDYWKVLKNGNLMWDGSFDLYDEEGRLLKRSDDLTFTGSFASATGMSYEEAKAYLGSDALNIAYRKGRMISLTDGKDKTDDAAFEFKTPDTFKARYDFQINYADKVVEKYGGSMLAAAMCYQNDVMFGNTNISVNPAYYASKEYLFMLLEINSLANKYDDYASIYYSREKNLKYNSKEAKDYMKQIQEAVLFKNVTNSTAAYDAFGPDGALNPIGNINTRISTKATYSDGKTHLFGNPKGFSVDITRSNEYLNLGKSIMGSPIYTNTDSWLYPFSINSNSYNRSTGNEVRLFGDNNTYIYGHLQDNSSSTELLRKLMQSANSSSLWRIFLPAGTQIGTVGNSGKSTGPHLHWEYRERYQYWFDKAD